jgi:hypothetical protein
MLEVTGAAKALRPPTAAATAAAAAGTPRRGGRPPPAPQAPLNWPALYAGSKLAVENKRAAAELVATCLESCEPLKVPGAHAAAFGRVSVSTEDALG